MSSTEEKQLESSTTFEDPALLNQSHAERMRAARLRMQEQHNALARQHTAEQPRTGAVNPSSPSVDHHVKHNIPPKRENDPGLNRDQNDARRAAWLRMQDQMNADAEQYKAKLLEEEREKQEKEKLIEEEKRKQKIKKWESMQEGTSYQGHTKVTQPETREPTTAVKRRRDKKPLRQNDYNPLTGEGGSNYSYRSTRSNPSRGG